ncbi:MAG: metal-dependent hydrolase [candidate division WOR-3 bacterium]
MVKITYLGHSAFKIEGSKVIFIDPFITGNPKSPIGDVNKVDKADVVIVTHDHGDHGFEDAVKICKKTGAYFVSQYELVVKSGLQKVEPMNIGGFVNVGGLGVEVAFTPAWHTAQLGDPTGVIVKIDGKTIYHAGDTGLFSDMKLIGELYKPDLALLPIGSRFTMDVFQAAKAVEFISPKYVIPMHYNTFDLIKADPEEFKKLVGDKAHVVILNPGESFEI